MNEAYVCVTCVTPVQTQYVDTSYPGLVLIVMGVALFLTGLLLLR